MVLHSAVVDSGRSLSVEIGMAAAAVAAVEVVVPEGFHSDLESLSADAGAAAAGAAAEVDNPYTVAATLHRNLSAVQRRCSEVAVAARRDFGCKEVPQVAHRWNLLGSCWTGKTYSAMIKYVQDTAFEAD